MGLRRSLLIPPSTWLWRPVLRIFAFASWDRRHEEIVGEQKVVEARWQLKLGEFLDISRVIIFLAAMLVKLDELQEERTALRVSEEKVATLEEVQQFRAISCDLLHFASFGCYLFLSSRTAQ